MTIFRPWTIGRSWLGEDAFLLCGGTSLNPETVQRLRGRPKANVVAINRSYMIAPWADILFFADDRWWTEEHVQHRGPLLRSFEGMIATTARHTKSDLLWHLKKISPTDKTPLSTDPTTVALESTSTTGALNLAMLKGARRIVLVGCDNRAGDNGRTHHHPEYPWERVDESWKIKERELRRAATGLVGVKVINASPGSALNLWPIVELGAWLDKEDSNAQG